MEGDLDGDAMRCQLVNLRPGRYTDRAYLYAEPGLQHPTVSETRG